MEGRMNLATLKPGDKVTFDPNLIDWEAAHSLRSKKHDHHMCIECQPLWYYQAYCSECEGNPRLLHCAHDPKRTITAEEWTERYRVQRREQKTQVAEGELTTTGRRRRGSVRPELPEEELQTALDRLDAGEGVTAIAFSMNVRQPWLSAYFKEQGREIKRGAGKALEAARAARKAKVVEKPEPVLTEAQKKAVAAKYKAYTSVKSLADQYGIPANLIKAAIEESGVRLRSKAEAMTVAREANKGGKSGGPKAAKNRKSHPVQKVQPNKKGGRRK
jgi:hypothetical protein